MISTVFAQLKHMMTMAFMIFHRLIAVLAKAFIALVNVLFERQPILDANAPIPGETLTRNVVYHESSQTLPHLIDPHITSPYQTNPDQSIPYPDHKESPFLALPDQTMPVQTALRPFQAKPYQTRPVLTQPHPHHKGLTYEPQSE